MKVLIVYGTTEGHTRDLCGFIGEALSLRGAYVTEVEASPTAPSPESFDVCFVAASLHVARYQTAVIEYVRRVHDALSKTRASFISVSLAAAGENPDDWAGLDECVARFRNETGWTPAAVHHAAGAIRYSHYDFFKRLMLQSIARKRGKKTVTSRDYDLTDYDALQQFAIDFAFGPEKDLIAVSPAPVHSRSEAAPSLA
jgi:menaquinone-dependent protoporphyrinogen oxidase